MGYKPSEKMSLWRKPAEHWGRQTGCPAALILAVIQQESGGHEGATRFEADFLANNPKLEPRVRLIMQKCSLSQSAVTTSYGLMQLMLTTAWGYLSETDKGPQVTAALLDPDKNIRYGAAHLGALLKKHRRGAVIDAAVIRAVAGTYNGAKSESVYARNVCALWRKYEVWLREA
ncbi:transglycosylase SLT domain-containing protein [Cloacibacillus evryensis]|uniref:transglycosylase SLT domain-containing protein n=1 Tax=Cloacibacillus evryensis TaxID=508460 RepID=UPI002671D5B0|nr:transglycosylase SLT domain-containing protein [Cloacibacillus evryensis]